MARGRARQEEESDSSEEEQLLDTEGSSSDSGPDAARGRGWRRRGGRLRAAATIGVVVAALLFVVYELGRRAAEAIEEAEHDIVDALPESLGGGASRRAHGFCNPRMAIPRDVGARKLELFGEWEEKCFSLPHAAHWEPPPTMQPRNWCWVSMKQIADDERFHMKNLGSVNWWWTQGRAFQLGLAPDPKEQEIQALEHPTVCDNPSNGAPLEGVPDEDWDAAGRWFAANVSVFVVNLPEATMRMRKIAARLDHLQIAYERIDGINMGHPFALHWAKENDFVPKDWDYEAVKKRDFEMYRSGKGWDSEEQAKGEMGLGTVGCTAAHLNAMRIAASTARKQKKPLVLILEDDAWLEDGFVLKLYRMLTQEAPCDWEAINLKSYTPYGECVSPRLSRVHPDGNEPEERCRKGANWGFTAMLYLTSSLDNLRMKLAATTWDETRPSCIVQDMALAALADQISYYAVPAAQAPGFIGFIKSGSARINVNNR
eukprot:TRINITY_DN22596_c0_g4_i1.p1 TRINITY_DN22596_c0_g4~~TRINITY_DN22596_c0_g4_i1.p1  ORF type:complete len:508 (+),score=129.38 TRINITY_DN22596_c0_g4_i1:69-1526(+)